jgi:glutaredoxin
VTGAVTAEPRVVVLTRVGCHLCEQAIAVVAQVCAETGEQYATRDIDASPELQRFTDEVPVTFVDGAQHDFWRVDPARLKKALSRRRKPS